MNRLILLIIFLGSILRLSAQEVSAQKSPMLIESSAYLGTPIRHSSKITFSTKRISWGQDININWQTTGKKKWQEKHNYPRIGVHFLTLNLGERDTLGSGFGIAPNISFAIFNNERWDARFQLSYGLAYVNKIFDEERNPLNNSISSNFNATAVFKLENQFRIQPKWWIKGGVNLIHYSNGANSVPNLGINIMTGSIGVSYRPNESEQWNKLENGVLKYQQNRWGGDLQAGVGFRERQVANGPRYPIYSASAALVYRATLVHHLRIGFEYEYNRSAFVFGKHIWNFDDDRRGRRGAARWNIFYAHEFRFGAMGIYLLIGFNANPDSILVNSNIYNKYSFRYYFPEIGNPKTTFYISSNLKSHVTIAEYYSLSIGATF